MKILRKLPDPLYWNYDEGECELFKLHDFFFTTDDRFEFVDNIEDAEIVPLLPPTNIENLKKSDIKLRDNQVAVIMHFYAIDDHMAESYLTDLIANYSHIAKNVIVIHKNSKLKDFVHDNIFYYDSMFDTCKRYFTEYDDRLYDKIWCRHSNSELFNLPEIATYPDKKYIYASYVYPPYTHPRMKYRHKLREFLKDYEDIGYIGDDDNRLLPNNPTDIILHRMQIGPVQWYPLADEFYQNTYLSIVVETIVGVEKNKGMLMNTGCVTEKTLEPLAKGNFVLPFGYPGLIQDILDYGFRLPDWIDYSYDKIEDPDLRFERFLKSIKNVLSMPIDEMMNVHYYKDKVDILEYNRQVFFDRPYDDLYTKLEDKVRNLPR